MTNTVNEPNKMIEKEIFKISKFILGFVSIFSISAVGRSSFEKRADICMGNGWWFLLGTPEMGIEIFFFIIF